MASKLKFSHLKAWDAFLRSHSEIVGAIERDLEGGLSFTKYDILFVINSAPLKRLRMTEIAEQIVLSKSALTRSIDRLEKEGLLKRVHCPEDRRVSYAAITSKGHLALKQAWPDFRAAIQRHFGSKLTLSEAKILNSILRKLLRTTLRD